MTCMGRNMQEWPQEFTRGVAIAIEFTRGVEVAMGHGDCMWWGCPWGGGRLCLFSGESRSCEESIWGRVLHGPHAHREGLGWEGCLMVLYRGRCTNDMHAGGRQIAGRAGTLFVGRGIMLKVATLCDIPGTWVYPHR